VVLPEEPFLGCPVAGDLAALNATFDVVTIDAHLDFRDEIRGERFARSSPARRMSEMPHVRSVAQIGRGGSAARERPSSRPPARRVTA
jgi:arginase family enzyme